MFLLKWIPALTKSEGTLELPFLPIYCTFMTCCMTGSCLYNIFIEHWKDNQIAVASLAGASLAMIVTVWSNNTTWKFLAMSSFQVMVGMYQPSISTMKAAIVPECNRAAIYSVYAAPLKLIMIFTLVSRFTSDQFYGLNALILGLACGFQIYLTKQQESHANIVKSDSTGGKPVTDMNMTAVDSTDEML